MDYPFSFLELLASGLEELGFEKHHAATVELLGHLEAYLQEIDHWNERFGLIAYKNLEELVVKHFLDSLAGFPLLGKLTFSSLADIGSGAGLPGIPLALAFPKVKTSLVERSGKRCTFLESTLAVLGRPDVAVVSKPFEEVKEKFDLLTFRAFSPLDVPLIKSLKKMAAPGAFLAAYKGRRETFEPEVEKVASLVSSIRVEKVAVPYLNEERHLVLMQLSPNDKQAD